MKAILLNRILLVLAFVGLFIAGVLSLEAGLNLEVPCGGGGGCAIVAKDPSSRIAGIPVAYIGLVGYLLLAGLAVMRSLTPAREWRRLVSFGYLAAVVGAGVSLWLQYKSFFVIHATCLWCLSSAVLMVVTLIVYALLAQEMDNLPAAREDGLVPDTGTDETPVPAPLRPQKLDTTLIASLPVALGIGLVIMGMTMKNADGFQNVPENISKTSMDTLIPKGANQMGPNQAPLTIVEFADLCCPACKRTTPQVEDFVKQHSGRIRYVYRHYPLPMHHESMTAAAIAEIAADEHLFWQYITAVMGLPEEPENAEQLISIAKNNGVDEKKIRERLTNTDDPIYQRLGRDMAAVKELGINSTPTFFMISGGKVIQVLGPQTIMENLNSDKYKKIIAGNGA